MEVLTPFVDLFFASNRALKESSNVSHEIASQLRFKVGDVDSKKVDKVTTFGFINAQTSETVLRALRAHTDGVLESAETLIMWCKQRQARQNREDEDVLKKCELAASLLLGRSVHTAKELAKTNFRVECVLDHVVPILTRLYSTMAALAKYFCNRRETHTKEVGMETDGRTGK